MSNFVGFQDKGSKTLTLINFDLVVKIEATKDKTEFYTTNGVVTAFGVDKDTILKLLGSGVKVVKE